MKAVLLFSCLFILGFQNQSLAQNVLFCQNIAADFGFYAYTNSDSAQKVNLLFSYPLKEQGYNGSNSTPGCELKNVKGILENGAYKFICHDNGAEEKLVTTNIEDLNEVTSYPVRSAYDSTVFLPAKIPAGYFSLKNGNIKMDCFSAASWKEVFQLQYDHKD